MTYCLFWAMERVSMVSLMAKHSPICACALIALWRFCLPCLYLFWEREAIWFGLKVEEAWTFIRFCLYLYQWMDFLKLYLHFFCWCDEMSSVCYISNNRPRSYFVPTWNCCVHGILIYFGLYDVMYFCLNIMINRWVWRALKSYQFSFWKVQRNFLFYCEYYYLVNVILYNKPFIFRTYNKVGKRKESN